MVGVLAEKYHRLPSEILKLDPRDFYLNLAVAFPEGARHRKRMKERIEKERKLGYDPVKKLLNHLKSAN